MRGELMPNALGQVLTPSCVGVDETGAIFVGQAAKERLITHPALQKHKDHLAKLNASLEHIAITAKPVIVINNENGESMEFRSMTQAANHFQVHPETISRCIKKK